MYSLEQLITQIHIQSHLFLFFCTKGTRCIRETQHQLGMALGRFFRKDYNVLALDQIYVYMLWQIFPLKYVSLSMLIECFTF